MQIGLRRMLFGLTVAATAFTGMASAQASAPSLRTYPSALSPSDIARLSANPTEKVIVLMKDQHAERPAARRANAARAQVLASDQQHVTDELRTLRVPKLRSYSLINAVSATMSHAEAQRLAADPTVLAVVPDAVVKAPALAPAAPATRTSAVTPTIPTPAPGVCPTNPAKPLLEPEALQSMNVEFPSGSTQPAAHNLATGAGVKIAVFPDGLDPTIPNWQRNGQSVIFDYQDFSGDGTSAPTSGAEAFGDVSSIAAQGTQVYDLSKQVNAAHPLPAGCNIKIKGVAPDANIAVMKVFGTQSSAFNSEILQGIEYAVVVDGVDILSQSFGGNPVPNPGTDPIAIVDAQAVAAGVTVVVSSGDAGTTSTIGTPATNPGVISVAATTTYRLYAQTGSYGYQLGGGGWVSDQVSALSSSGVTEYGPRTVDVAAPGEAGWANCSSNLAQFAGCGDIYKGSMPQPIIAFGGTSQSCPFVAATAALVIQSYRSTHGGATPSPALVKQIIKSSAQDLNVRSDNQGAGLVDALRAVQMARSIQDAHGTPTRTGRGLLYSTNQVSLTGLPGTSITVPVSVTNTGIVGQTVSPAVRALGAATTVASGVLALNPAIDPTFTYQTGGTVGDVHKVTFNVDPGTDRLVSRIAWDTSGPEAGTTVRATLFDPYGRIVSHSRPQGAGGGFGEDEIHNPTFGTWTLLVFTTGSPQYKGPLHYEVSEAQFHDVPGAVSPTQQVIPPGGTATFHVIATTPPTPGDRAEAVVFGTSFIGDSLFPPPATIPVLLRALVPVSTSTPGSFHGTLTGGNARMPFYGQELVYQFDVPADVPEVNVDLSVAADGYQLFGFLVSPDNNPVDVQTTQDQGGSPTLLQTMHLSWRNPAPGRWNLDLAQVFGISSLRTHTGFSGTINFAPSVVSGTGVPSGATKLTRGAPVIAHIHVLNNGNSPEYYSVDPRQNTSAPLSLTSLFPTSNLPLPVSGNFPLFVVPPFTTRLDMAASSTVPINFTTSPNFGNPETPSVGHGTDAEATVINPSIPASIWACPPTEIGPFPTTSTATTFSCGAVAVTKQFDPAVTSSTGNIWSFFEGLTNTYAPLKLMPGQTGDISVTFTPQADRGDVVSGFLALETFNFNSFSSDQLAVIPYRYTVK